MWVSMGTFSADDTMMEVTTHQSREGITSSVCLVLPRVVLTHGLVPRNTEPITLHFSEGERCNALCARSVIQLLAGKVYRRVLHKRELKCF